MPKVPGWRKLHRRGAPSLAKSHCFFLFAGCVAVSCVHVRGIYIHVEYRMYVCVGVLCCLLFLFLCCTVFLFWLQKQSKRAETAVARGQWQLRRVFLPVKKNDMYGPWVDILCYWPFRVEGDGAASARSWSWGVFEVAPSDI